MQEKYRNDAPKWTNEIDKEYDLMLGDDTDSLLSCGLLKHITSGKWEVNWFYDFENIGKIRDTKNKAIGVDMAMVKGNIRAFDNHIFRNSSIDPHNENIMNLNITAGRAAQNQYYKKYPLSTLAMIMSYYNVPLPDTDEGKAIILAIDSGFKGFYNKIERFRLVSYEWLEVLEMQELSNLIHKKDEKYFRDIQQKYGLNEKVYADAEGKIHTEIKLDEINKLLNWKTTIPTDNFEHLATFQRTAHEIGKNKMPPKDKIISLSYTGKAHVSYTYSG